MGPLGTVVLVAVALLLSGLKVLKEFERAVVFRLGRLVRQRGPGITYIIPMIERAVRVDLRTITWDIPAQDVITKDNVSVKVNAVVYFRVIDPSQLQILAAVPVADLSRVTPGRRGRATGPGGGDAQAVTVLTRPAQIDPKTTLADVRLAFARRTTLPAGAAVTVEIVAETRPNVLVVPSAAIVRDGDDTFVMIAGSDNKAHKKAVKTGLESQERVEILSGLTAGDQVIVHGQEDLPDNAAITVSK